MKVMRTISNDGGEGGHARERYEEGRDEEDRHRHRLTTRLSPIQLAELLGVGIILLLSPGFYLLIRNQQNKECTIAHPPPINPATSHGTEILPSIAELALPCLLEPELEFEPEPESVLEFDVTTVWLV